MESKLNTLSTVIIVSGVISAIIITISGLIIFGDLNSTRATAEISGYVLIASLVTAFSLFIATLAIAFSLQAKAEQLATEKEMLKYCHYINSNVQALTDAQSAAQQTDGNDDKKQILLLIQINHQPFFQKKKMLVQVGYVKIAKKLTPERIRFAQSAVIQNR